jgi:hypothetical protein
LPHTDWATLRALPYDELGEMREWLRKAFVQEPPRVRLAGLWFGLFHPVTGCGGSTTDIRLGPTRSRVEGDKRTARSRGPRGSRGLGFAVEWPEDEAVDRPQGDHRAGAGSRGARLSTVVGKANSSTN